MNDFVTRYAQWVTSHKWLVIILTLLLVIGTFAGMRSQGGIKLSSDYTIFFKDDNPQVQAFDALQKVYTKTDSILIVVEPKNGDVFTKENLLALRWLTEESWKLPSSLRVDSVTNYQHSWAEGDELIVRDLVDPYEELTPETVAKIRETAVNEPFLVNRLISEKGHVTGINITLNIANDKKNIEIPKAVAATRDLVAQFETENPNFTVRLTGNIMMSNAFQEAFKGDMRGLMPIMIGLVAIMLMIMLRSLSGTVGTLVTIIFSILLGMGSAIIAGAIFSVPVASAPTIILTMAVADSVHLLTNFLQGMRRGETKQEAMIESIRINFHPIVLTSITTAIGFLTMNFSDSPPFHLLGNTVAVGVMAAMLLSLSFLPAMMMALPVKVKARPENNTYAMDKVADIVVANPKKSFLFTLAIVIGLTSFITKNEFNDQFHKYFDETVEFRQDTDFAIENLTGVYIIDYSVESAGTGEINEPEYLEKLEAFTKWLQQQPEVIHVATFTDIMKKLNKNMNADDEEYYRLPDARDLAAQYLLLYEMSLPYGLDLNNQVDLQKSATRLTVTMKAVTSNEMISVEQRASAWLKANGLESMKDDIGSGAGVMFAHIGKTNAISMLYGSLLALVIISGLLIFALRSLKLGFISLIPNLVPAAMAYGLWGMTNGQISMALSLVAGMTLGIVVDDTIHFLSKYQRAIKEKGKDAVEAVRYAFHTVGTAMWVTSVILVAGFMVLASSHFKMNSDMGLMTSATILFALFADFFLLAPLLMFLEKRKNA